MALPNSRHELFAQSVVEGHSLTQAAVRSGYAKASAPNAASRLAKMKHVADRIADLRSLKESGEDLTTAGSKAWIVSKLILIADIALGNAQAVSKEPDLAGATKALVELARIRGFIVSKSESESKRLNVTVGLPSQQLNATLKEQYGQLTPGERDRLRITSPDIAEVLDAELVDEPD